MNLVCSSAFLLLSGHTMSRLSCWNATRTEDRTLRGSKLVPLEAARGILAKMPNPLGKRQMATRCNRSGIIATSSCMGARRRRYGPGMK